MLNVSGILLKYPTLEGDFQIFVDKLDTKVEFLYLAVAALSG